jgi:hypothetical protein
MIRTIVFIISTPINDLRKFHKALLFKRHRAIIIIKLTTSVDQAKQR